MLSMCAWCKQKGGFFSEFSLFEPFAQHNNNTDDVMVKLTNNMPSIYARCVVFFFVRHVNPWMVIWYIKLQNSLRKRKNLYSNNKYRKLYHYIFGYLLNLLATVGAHVHKFFPIKYSTFGVNYRSTFTLLFKYSVACKDKGTLRRTNKGTTFTQQYTMLFSLSFSLSLCMCVFPTLSHSFDRFSSLPVCVCTQPRWMTFPGSIRYHFIISSVQKHGFHSQHLALLIRFS